MKGNKSNGRSKAFGVRVDGVIKTYAIYQTEVYCWDERLVSLELKKGCRHIFCQDNELTFLHIPKGALRVVCHNNNLLMLNLPDSVNYLRCDRDLFDYDTCKITLVEIIYER